MIAADTGEPFRDATVLLQPVDQPRVVSPLPLPKWVGSAGRPVDTEGRFEIGAVTAGVYRLIVTPGPMALQYVETVYPDPTADDQAPLTIAAGQTIDDLTIAMNRGAAITGRVVDERGSPLAMVSVMVREALAGDRLRPPSGLAAGNFARTDDTGSFRVFGLPSGDYVVQARPTFAPRTPGSPMVIPPFVYYPGTFSVRDALRVRVRAGEVVGPLELPLVEGRLNTIQGVVIDSTGRPVPSAKVTLQNVTSTLGVGSLGDTVTNATGAFVLNGLAPGEYALAVFLYGDGRREFAWMPVSVAGDLDEVIVKLTGGATVTGQVTFEGSAPDTFTWMRVRPVASPGALVSSTIQPNQDGTFRLQDLFGPTLIRTEGPTGWFLKSVVYGGRDIADEPISFPPGDSSVKIVMTDTMASLTGVVSNERGVVPAAMVMLLSAEEALRRERSTSTQVVLAKADGRYSFQGLRAGRYLVVAFREELGSATDSTASYYELLAQLGTAVTIADNEARSLDLKITALK